MTTRVRRRSRSRVDRGATTISSVVAAAAAIAILVAAVPSAQAQTSAITDAFVVETSRDISILHQADRVAITEPASLGLQAFARRNTLEQSAAYEDLTAWAQAERRGAKAAALTPTIDGLGPILYPFDAVVIPLNVDGPPATRADHALLAQLQSLHGRDFAALYLSAQTGALARLERTYVDYIKNGDDPQLRRLAVVNLPKVRRLLAELRRL